MIVTVLALGALSAGLIALLVAVSALRLAVATATTVLHDRRRSEQWMTSLRQDTDPDDIDPFAILDVARQSADEPA